MLLGALVDAGVPLEVLQEAVDAVGVEPVRLSASVTTRAGLGATKVDVSVSDDVATRTWSDVRALLEAADLPDPVRRTALDVFARLATAEGAVHRVPADEVHFHEVGALDAVADVVGVAAGLHALGLTELQASTVSLGSGTSGGRASHSAHGPLPVPAPAVLALLHGVPVQAGPAPYELTTPTGAALLAANVTRWGPLPPMTVDRVGCGAGGRDPVEVANVLRLVLGSPAAVPSDLARPGTALLLETNIDDLDPRLWPAVLSRLLAVGAADAWLTPILMKKGRPAHTLSVLCSDTVADAVRREVFCETSTIGLREQRVAKLALDRTESFVDVDGQRIRVKLAWLDGRVVNAMPEWEDVAAAAAALGRPGKLVLQQAQAAVSTTGTARTVTG
jgi:uncharacterized protein (TIGR00299 family) protein